MINEFLRLKFKNHFLCFLCLFVALLGEPSIGIEEFDSDAPVAVDVVNP